jgi:hypothetical protein
VKGIMHLCPYLICCFKLLKCADIVIAYRLRPAQYDYFRDYDNLEVFETPSKLMNPNLQL